MTRNDISGKIENLLASGVPKAVVFRTLSGGDVGDRTLAHIIGARVDPRRCEEIKWRIRALVIIAYIQVVLAFFVGLGIGIKFSLLAGLAAAVASGLFSFLFRTWISARQGCRI
jgi:hypothetical protein